jgi:hypothetical protein
MQNLKMERPMRYEVTIPSNDLVKLLYDEFTLIDGEYQKRLPAKNSTLSFKKRLLGILRDFLDRW